MQTRKITHREVGGAAFAFVMHGDGPRVRFYLRAFGRAWRVKGWRMTAVRPEMLWAMKAIQNRRNWAKPAIIAPDGSTVCGRDAEGRTVYTRTLREWQRVPKVDENGERVWREHSETGEPMYPLMALQAVVREQRFVLEHGGSNNVYVQEV